MPLPVLPSHTAPDSSGLLRLFHQSLRQWSGHLGEETALDIGSAIHNSAYPKVFDANTLFDASLPAGSTPAEFMRELEEHYASHNVRCAAIVLNPSVPADQRHPLETHLAESGWNPIPTDVFHTGQCAMIDCPTVDDVKIIPARAGFRQLRELVDQWCAPHEAPGLAEATMLHYDDPSYDALLALRDGKAVGHAGVLTSGEVGFIDDVYVIEPMRGRGLGRVMLNRVMESCRRGLLRHVMLAVAPDNVIAQRLYASFGFVKIGRFITWRAVWTTGSK